MEGQIGWAHKLGVGAPLGISKVGQTVLIRLIESYMRHLSASSIGGGPWKGTMASACLVILYFYLDGLLLCSPRTCFSANIQCTPEAFPQDCVPIWCHKWGKRVCAGQNVALEALPKHWGALGTGGQEERKLQRAHSSSGRELRLLSSDRFLPWNRGPVFVFRGFDTFEEWWPVINSLEIVPAFGFVWCFFLIKFKLCTW